MPSVWIGCVFMNQSLAVTCNSNYAWGCVCCVDYICTYCIQLELCMHLAEIRSNFSTHFPLMTFWLCCLLTATKAVDEGEKTTSKHFGFHSLDHSPDSQALAQYWVFLHEYMYINNCKIICYFRKSWGFLQPECQPNIRGDASCGGEREGRCTRRGRGSHQEGQSVEYCGERGDYH